MVSVPTTSVQHLSLASAPTASVQRPPTGSFPTATVQGPPTASVPTGTVTSFAAMGVHVTGVDSSSDGQFGKTFFFEPADMGQFFGQAWNNQTLQVTQFREGQPIWRGQIIVTRAGASCYGKRAIGDQYGQWAIDDEIAPDNAQVGVTMFDMVGR